MNRIYIKYIPAKNNICSNLEILNDLKGYTCEKIGHTFYGKDADIMLEYFQNAIMICGVAIILISNIVTALLVKNIIEERENNKECIVFNDSRYCKEV